MEKKRRIFVVVFLGAVLLLGSILAFGNVVHAATPVSLGDVGSSVGLGTADLLGVVLNVIRWILGILALVAVSYIIYGGFLWLTSAGDEKRIDKAKRVILNAVIGLIIVLIAWAIVFFVARTVNTVSNGGPDESGPPGCCLPPGGSSTGFEITSITTDSGTVGDYRSDVHLCSAVQVSFNHQVDAATVAAAVNDGSLLISQCGQGDDCTNLSVPDNSALDGDPASAGPGHQAYSPNFPTGTKGEWVVKSDNSGKTFTFLHNQKLLEPATSFHVAIPVSVKDTAGKPIVNCQISTGVPVPGCTPEGAPVTRYTWTMKAGTTVDTSRPKRTSSYPTSLYKNPDRVAGVVVDQNVLRTPIMSITYDQAILGTIDQTHNANPAERLLNTFAIIPFTPNATTPDLEDQTAQGDPVNPDDYLVAMSPDSMSVQIQLKPGKQLDKFQWYRVQVLGFRDLCNNLQDPDPFSWVFETNDVVPGIADYFPQNGTGINPGTTAACGNTPIFIRYTTSMYDIANSTCQVPLGYVTAGSIIPAPATPRTFSADASCTVYTFSPPPPSAEPLPTGELTPGTTYKVGVDNRYTTNDSGSTLRFGSGTWGDAGQSIGGVMVPAWKFKVGAAGDCVNPPVITYIDPSSGASGQCISVNGYNFDRVAGYGAGDNLSYGGAALTRKGLPNEQVLNWSDTQITAEVPAGPDVSQDFTVSGEFPAPFGTLTSPGVSWTRSTPGGAASTGPCLASVNPNVGYNPDNVTLNGKRFDATSSTKEVHWDTATDHVIQTSPPLWIDTQVNTNVPTAALLPPPVLPLTDKIVNVKLKNNSGTSNTVQFDLKKLNIPPGTPEPPVVTEFWPSCGLSCVGADLGAKFAYPSGAPLTMDATTFIPGAAITKMCSDATCTGLVGGNLTPTISYEGPLTNKIHFPPAASLIPNKSYRVILKGTIKDTATPATALGQLNFDSGSGSADSYSWIFGTQATAGSCQLGRVEVAPLTDFFTFVFEQHHPFVATAYTVANACSATGQPMNPNDLSWSWSSDPSKATVTPDPAPDTWKATVKAVDQTVPGPATVISATGTETATSRNRTGTSSVTIDYGYCNDDTPCQAVCAASTCDQVSHRCKPVVTSISPNTGEVGTWVGVNGCFFGSYSQGTCNGGADNGEACDINTTCDNKDCQGGSAVIFTNNKRGLWPNPAMCGVPSLQWGESHIKVEVPDRDDGSLTAGTGPLLVQRSDGLQASSAPQNFQVDPLVKVPGICKVEPPGGSDGTDVTITGQNFKEPKVAADKVTFYKEKDVAAGDYTSWTDKVIVCKAPIGISNNIDATYQNPVLNYWGKKEVAVKVDNRFSNIENFDVVPPGCSICSAASPVCGAGNSCGYNSCCTSNPAITSTSPASGAINVCRNSIIKATFSRDMDPGTINATTVSVYKFGVPVPAAITYDAPSRTVRINAGLLDKNEIYRVVFQNMRAADGGLLGNGFYQWFFTTVNSNSLCGVSRVFIDPPQWSFTKSGDLKTFTAHPIADSGDEISKISGVYDWKWDWSVTDNTVIDFSVPPGDVSTASLKIATPPKKGTVYLLAKAKPLSPTPIGLTADVSGLATLQSTVCEDLWLGSQFQDAGGNCSAGGGSCLDYHFNLSYCLDGGLPNLDQPPTITSQTGQVVKEFLFRQSDPNSRDAIGIRIYNNPEGLSAGQWYQKYATNPGSTEPLSVDGYDAVRSGRTVYVGVQDCDGEPTCTGPLVSRIYFISITPNAAPGIQGIFNQFLQNWFFNNNVNTVCHTPPSPSVYPTVESGKTCMQRDIKRLAAISDLKQSLRAYKAKNGSYPKIESGSYLPQLTFSVWPSWRDRLGGDLGISPPQDPINKIANCPLDQAQDGSCWNETNKKFICLPDVPTPPSTGAISAIQSNIIGYQGSPSGDKAQLYVNLEYRGPGSVLNYNPHDGSTPALCTSPSTCKCFNYCSSASSPNCL